MNNDLSVLPIITSARSLHNEIQDHICPYQIDYSIYNGNKPVKVNCSVGSATMK